MRTAAILISLAALLVSLSWFLYAPGFDSAISVVTSIGSLVASSFMKQEQGAGGQTQTISGSSVGIQAGRDININDVSK
jgi:hypothetical protein